MKEIILMLPYLTVAVACNVATGMYFKIGIEKFDFSWKKLIVGVIKAIIVCGTFVGFAYIIEVADIGVTPKALMISVIVLYGTKAVSNLKNILGIKDTKDIEDMVDTINTEGTSID